MLSRVRRVDAERGAGETGRARRRTRGVLEQRERGRADAERVRAAREGEEVGETEIQGRRQDGQSEKDEIHVGGQVEARGRRGGDSGISQRRYPRVHARALAETHQRRVGVARSFASRRRGRGG